MSEVEIPFMERFEEDMLEDIKICTSRTDVYGIKGDMFKKFGAEFMIICTVKLPLSTVAQYLYREEGCSSPRDFKDTWINLHPKKGYVPDQIVNTHFFTRIR